MDQQQKKPREDEAAAVEKQAAARDERQGEEQAKGEQEGGEEQQAAETRKANELAGVAHFQRLYASMAHILQSETLEIPHDLPHAEQNALELLFQAKAGEHENSVYAAGLQCMRFLNRSLATLQPSLAVARRTENPMLQKMYADLQVKVGELRLELRQRIMKEAHKGGRKKRGGNTTEQREEELSAMGSLAWELAQLVKKRKRKRFAHDLDEHPVGLALEAMASGARGLGKVAADLARLDAKLTAATDAELRAGLQTQLDGIARKLHELLAGLFEAAAEGADDAGRPGAHPNLHERLAPVIKRAKLDTLEGALAAARHYVEVAHAAMDDQDAIVAAEQKSEKRGILGTLFGRRKKS